MECCICRRKSKQCRCKKYSIRFGIAPKVIAFKLYEGSMTHIQALTAIRKTLKLKGLLQLHDSNWKPHNKRLKIGVMYIVRHTND